MRHSMRSSGRSSASVDSVRSLFSSAEILRGRGHRERPLWSGSSPGVGGRLSAGTLVAFLFLVTLFIEPVQMLVEILDHAQSAGAGVRRILSVLETRRGAR